MEKLKYLAHITHNTNNICGGIKMVNITLSVSSEIKKLMDKFPEINWSEVARKAISDKSMKMAIFEQIVSKSKLTEENALELGRKVNKAVAKKFRELKT